MTTVSTNRPSHTQNGIAAVLLMAIGSNFAIPSPSTANPFQGYFSQPEESRISTAQPVTPIQVEKPSTAETQLPEWREDLYWPVTLVAGIEAQRIVGLALEETPTEEASESFEVQFSEFIDQYGVAGIAALESRLLRPNDPALEPWGWAFLTALGNSRGPSIEAAAKRVLIGQIASPSAGRRAAAASAMGAFQSPSTLAVLEQRAAIETNRVVLATLQAHIRVLKGNGISAKTAA